MAADSRDDAPLVIRDVAERIETARRELGRVVRGQQALVDGTLVAVLAGGHVLLEGAPGLGKTLLARSLAYVLGCRFRRVQFTPDLMPADITGGNIYNQQAHRFEFVPGPVFCEVLLADEINRAPARTQAALLEAMSDRQVTVDGTSRLLGRPFLTLATQNPVESEGTWPLPEAQLDRFLFKLLVTAPTRAVEADILAAHLEGLDPADLDAAGLVAMFDAASLAAAQDLVRGVRVSRPVIDYVCDLVARTREHPAIYLGASPRASIGLVRAAQVVAVSEGRDFVVPDDAKGLAPAVLRHRVILHAEAELDGGNVEGVVADIVTRTPVPAKP